MKIVIDIPEDYYKAIKEIPVEQSTADMMIIRKGTPLPKGHGRLIDADALEKKMCDRETEMGDDKALWESSAVSVALDMFAQTIIEADRSEET
jgi:hypothetical protein